MSKNAEQSNILHRVSLQINSQATNSDHFNDIRSGVCYSTNLKKRTDMLRAQKAGINQILQKTQSLTKTISYNQRAQSSSSHQKRKVQGSSHKTNNNYQTILKDYSKKQCQIKINMDKIQIKANRYPIKERSSFQTTHYKHVASHNAKNNKINTISQNDSVKTQQFKNCLNLKQKSVAVFMQTCPDFGDFKQNRNKQNIKAKNKNIFNPVKKNQNKFLSQNNHEGNKIKTQTSLDVCSKIISCSERLIKHQAQDIHNINISSKEQQKEGQKKLVPNSIKNKLLKPAPPKIETKYAHTQMAANKQTYKINNINFSQYLKNLQNQEKSTFFPICKKMTISNLNRFYELCIQQIKNRQSKEKQNIKQSEQENSQQQMHQSNQMILRQNIRAQKKEFSTLQNQFQSVNQTSLNNQSSKIEDESKNEQPLADKTFQTECQISGNFYNQSNILEQNFGKQTYPKHLQRNFSAQCRRSTQSRVKNNQFLHNHKNKKKIINQFNKQTQINVERSTIHIQCQLNHNPSVSKIHTQTNSTSPVKNKNQFEPNFNKQDKNKPEQQEFVFFTMCSKKQIVQRPHFNEESKKKLWNSYIKKFTMDFGTVEDPQQRDSQLKNPNIGSGLKMNRNRLSSSQKNTKVIKKSHQVEDEPLNAWDFTHQNLGDNFIHQGNEENF